MNILRLALVLLSSTVSSAMADETTSIAIVDSATPTEALLAKPGTYLGEKFTFEQRHSGEVSVQVGVQVSV